MVEGNNTILLVEDDAIIAMSEMQVLARAGYRVIQSVSGEQAVAAVREARHPINLILMDIDLGKGMDGTQAAQEILRDHDIPVLFLSSHTEKEIVDKTEKITSYGYVVKHTGDIVLLASIKMAFKLHRAHAALKESADQFNTITSTSMDGFLVITTSTHIIEANDAYCRMIGYSRQELLTMSISDIDVTPQPKGFVEHLGTGKSHGPEILECSHRRKDGTHIDVEISATFIRQQDRYLLFLHDITNQKRAEASLRASEERFHSVWNNSADGLRLTDRDGLIIDVNDAYAAMVKIPREQLLGRVFSTTYAPQRPSDDLTLYQHRFDSDELLRHLSAPATMWNGEVLELEISSSMIHTVEQGKLFLSMFRDITESKQARAKLARSELLYRTLVEGMSDVVLQVDNEDVVTFVNKRFCDFTGYTKEEVLGRIGYTFLADAKSQDIIREKNAERLGGVSDVYEILLQRKNLEPRWVRVSASPVYDESAHVTGSIGVIADISEAKRTEEALRKSEERYRNLIEQTPDGVYRSTHAGRFLEVNPAMVSILGYSSKEELLAIDIRSQLYFAPGDRESAALEQKLEEMAVFRLRKKDGSEVWVEDHGRHVLDEHGNVAYHEGIIRDVTTRKHAEEALQRLVVHNQVLLRELQHRVKNNLNIISSLLNLETPRLADEAARKIFIDAQGRIRSMSMIYEQLYTSDSLAHVEIRKYLTDLAGAILSSYALDTARTRLVTEVQDVHLDLKRAVPLGLIVNELLSNALKYAYPPPGEGEIRLELAFSGQEFRLRVSDDGTGLPQNFSRRVTESMGMKLVRLLVEQLDGTLTIEGIGGTSMIITFPS